MHNPSWIMHNQNYGYHVYQIYMKSCYIESDLDGAKTDLRYWDLPDNRTWFWPYTGFGGNIDYVK
jgi:hypothetical protein